MHTRLSIFTALTLALFYVAPAMARDVDFPPANSKPPPRAKAPPRTQTSGEDTGLITDFGATMRKTQERTPPPPTNLTVMYKVKYGQTLTYTHPDGRKEKFDQWRSYNDDGHRLMDFVNDRLGDGNNYRYGVTALSSASFDPLDIPLLYMTGDYEFVLSEEEVKSLRKFLLDGGTILFNAARGRDEFSLAVVREMQRVLPRKGFVKAPLDHPIFNTRYRIRQMLTNVTGMQSTQPPEVYTLDIGTRAAAILVPTGLGASWSNKPYHTGGKHLVGESAVRLGVNIVAYVLANTEYGRFLAQQFPLYEGQSRAGDVLRFAQVKYRGSWDVNPALQNSMMQIVHENAAIPVDMSPHALALDSPQLPAYPLLMMTGHYEFELTDAQREGLRHHLNRGGLLVASAAAGLSPFDSAFRREMKTMFPDNPLMPLPPTHPIFERGWTHIDRVTYSPAALQDDPTLDRPRFMGLFINGRLAVLYTPYDVFSGLNHESNAYAKGLVPEDASRVIVNIITHALSH